jgi:hypothetical protein
MPSAFYSVGILDSSSIIKPNVITHFSVGIHLQCNYRRIIICFRHMAKKEIFLEESVLDDLSEGLDIIERPLSEKVFAFLGWATILVVVVIFGRVAWAQILSGQVYESRALANSGQQTILKAPRGIIYDRNGKILVSNESSFSVILNLSELLKDGASLDGVLSQISNIVPFDVVVAKQEILSVDLEHQAYLPLAQNIPLSEVIDLKKFFLT